ncbi:MAG: class I SAM-dependent methyltransferase [Pseudomonadota bacterium]
MSTSFADHFRSVSGHYAASRPGYPEALFDWLAAQCPAHELAWDCGCGSGQASAALARHFRQVVATDASAAQIAQASPHAGVEYRVAPAEASGLAAASVDLLVVAQALHWFDLARFHEEARRVLRLQGVIAVWSYGVIGLDDPALDAPVRHFYREVVGPYWPPERRHVENGYRDLPFPFDPIAAPAFAMRAEWPLDQLLGYLRSWSATARYIEARGEDPVEALAATLRPTWGDPATPRGIAWPLALRVGRRD